VLTPSSVGVVGATDAKVRGRPLTRTERRRQAQARRNRLILVLGVVASVGVVAAWFPASDLLHQRQRLAAATGQLHQLNDQNRGLRRQAKELETPAAVGRIAQQQYDLVQPGEQAYQVLPPSGSDGDGTLGATSSGTGVGASGSAGSAGSAGIGSSGGGSGGASDAASHAHPTGFLGRIVQSLEFWR
jgi:cell division protein FtsB